MADLSKNRMNLAAIKKVDPYAKDIVDSTAHVAFYTFNAEENEWEKTDVEGAFFIYSRNAEPFHSIFINNRLNTTSFVEPVTSQLEIQSQPPFLLYRNERSRIRGFWFYNSLECDRIGGLVCNLIQDCNLKQKSKGANGTQCANIFKMLSKAQQDFQCSLNTGSHQPDIGSRSVINFFASAKPALSSNLQFYRRLLSNTLSVEQLEKQQVKTPLNDVFQEQSQFDFENSRTTSLKKSEKAECEYEKSPLATFLNIKTMLKPAMFQKDCDDTKNINADVDQQSTSKPALMPPTMFEMSLKSDIDNINADAQALTCSSVKPLTQSQLVKTICHLMRNDFEFVKKIHEAYLKHFSDIPSDLEN